MAAEQKPQIEIRHRGRLHLNMASRCTKAYFTKLPVAVGSTVSLRWMQCWDDSIGSPDWKCLPKSNASATVGVGGRAYFKLIFGSISDVTLAKNHCSLVLFMQSEKKTPEVSSQSARLLPTLLYVLEGDGFSCTGRVKLYTRWTDAVFDESLEVFENLLQFKDDEAISEKVVVDYLHDEWKRIFRLHFRDSSQKEESCDDGTEQRELMTQPSSEIIHRLILIGTNSNEGEYPDVISRRAFCGDGTKDCMSIWRTFQILAELVGRSLFVRELFNHQQLILPTSRETVEIHTDKFVESNQSMVFFFRVPRSYLDEPALVLELFLIERSPNGIVLIPQRPTPYITVSQLEKSLGNPFVAFKNLESVHSALLSEMDIQNLLQPPEFCFKAFSPKGDHLILPSRIDFSKRTISDLPGSDVKWWSSTSP